MLTELTDTDKWIAKSGLFYFEMCGDTRFPDVETDFYDMLSLSECSGAMAVQSYYDGIVKAYFKDTKRFTNFVICLNWKIWQWHGLMVREGDGLRRNEMYLYSCLYDFLWSEAHQRVLRRWKDEDLSYYLEQTD